MNDSKLEEKLPDYDALLDEPVELTEKEFVADLLREYQDGLEDSVEDVMSNPAYPRLGPLDVRRAYSVIVKIATKKNDEIPFHLPFPAVYKNCTIWADLVPPQPPNPSSLSMSRVTPVKPTV